MNTNQFLKKTRRIKPGTDGILYKRPFAVCKDGFSISIQASDSHYCTPKTNDDVIFETVELGYPSKKEKSILKYAEDSDYPTGTVYAQVPVKIVDLLLEKHGGIDIKSVNFA